MAESCAFREISSLQALPLHRQSHRFGFIMLACVWEAAVVFDMLFFFFLFFIPSVVTECLSWGLPSGEPTTRKNLPSSTSYRKFSSEMLEQLMRVLCYSSTTPPPPPPTHSRLCNGNAHSFCAKLLPFSAKGKLCGNGMNVHGTA